MVGESADVLCLHMNVCYTEINRYGHLLFQEKLSSFSFHSDFLSFPIFYRAIKRTHAHTEAHMVISADAS